MRRAIFGLRRALLGLALVLLAVLAVRWLITRPVVRFSLGAGQALVTAPGVDGFVVREADSLWTLYDTHARQASDGQRLPTPVLGEPCFQKDGSVYLLTDLGLLWVHGSQPMHPGGEVLPALAAEALPAGTRLEGVVGGEDPLLSAPSDVPGQRQLLLCEGAPRASRLTVVRDADAEARMPADERPVLAWRARALAFRGEDGWEAWSLEGPHLGRRVVAEDCRKPGAVFTPDGRALIVPGRTDGIWQLSLADGRLDWMAEGNLGVSRRVEHRVGFRSQPAVLVAPGLGLEGYLQIFQTHLSGGGRAGFGSGFLHHYGVAVSPDDNFMTYAQAAFEEHGEQPFTEELYLFDFSQRSEPALFLDSRQGGGRGQGPAFLGDGGSLVYLARGEVMRIEVLPGSSHEEVP